MHKTTLQQLYKHQYNMHNNMYIQACIYSIKFIQCECLERWDVRWRTWDHENTLRPYHR